MIPGALARSTRLGSLRPLAVLILLIACLGLARGETQGDKLRALFKAGRSKEVLALADTYLSVNPLDVDILFLRGLSQVRLGNLQEAIATFTKLTELRPESPEPYNNLAVVYARLNDLEKARAYLQIAYRNNPLDQVTLENLGDIYALLARSAYNQSYRLDRSNTGLSAKVESARNLVMHVESQQAAAAAVEP